MKNFLVFLLELLISTFYMYVLFPIIFVGIMAWLWVPLFFEFEGAAVVIGIVTTILTLVVVGVVDYKLDSY